MFRINLPILMFLAAVILLPEQAKPLPGSGNDEPTAGKKAPPPNKKKSKRIAAKKSGKSTGKAEVDMSEVKPDAKAEKKGIEALGEGFKVHRTRHYSVLHNTMDEDVKAFSTAIEQTYRSCMKFDLKLRGRSTPPKKKLVIYYFQEHPAYKEYAKSLDKGELPEEMPGVYFPDLNISMFYNYSNTSVLKQLRESAQAEIDRLREDLRRGGVSAEQRRDISRQIEAARARMNRGGTYGGDASAKIVQHEVSHQVLWNIGVHNRDSFIANPRWFAEGLAMMFETTASKGGSNIGAVNKNRLEQYRELAKASKLVPLRDFVSTPRYFNESMEQIGNAYAQAWALVHFLNRTKRDGVKKFIERINSRSAEYETTPEVERADFEAAFGKPDDLWQRKWQKWMEKVH